MITLQNFIAPEQEICTEHELYYHTQGAVGFSQSSRSYHLSEGASISFDSYFNVFSLGKWNRGCALDSLFAELSGSGTFEIRVTHAPSGRSWEVAYCEIVTLKEGRPHWIDLSEFTGEDIEGVLYAQVMALEGGVRFTGGRFCTEAEPLALPRLAVSITTFKREEEVRRTVERLEEFLEGFAFGDRVHVQVVDNGQSAEIEKTPQVTPYRNPNLGGAGGFARGLLEAEKCRFSHCLFMDDDASFHMENIARTYFFLALSKDPRNAVAGAMINNTHKWAMWENGAWFDGSCHPLDNGADLRDINRVLEMELQSLRPRQKTLYGGWWFFAFAIDQVQHYPFPFFVRGDDISFSLMNQFKIFTLNGVVSFQDDFTEKESAQTLYLDLRNHLVHHLVSDQLNRSPMGTAKVAIRFIMRSLVRLHYESAQAQLLSWQDVMQGPEFFDENIDMAERRATIQSMMKNEVWRHVDELDLEQHLRLTLKSHNRRHRLGMWTLNGHLAPFSRTRWDKKVLEIGERGMVLPAFGVSQITYLNTNRRKGYTVVQSKLQFFRICMQMSWTLARFLLRYSALKAAYRSGYDNLTTQDYWEKRLI